MSTSLHPITNWPQYNKSLINRGSLTFWVDAEAMNNWFHHGYHGCRGRANSTLTRPSAPLPDAQGDFQPHSAGHSGTTRLPVRVDERTALCPRLQLCKQAGPHGNGGLSTAPKGRITDLVIDSPGLKVFGEGEWKVRKHGAEKRRVWRKLHLAVDPATHDIVAAEISLENVHDIEVLPTLLNPLRRKLGRVYADGAYDSKASHQLILRKGATACIPPRKSAGLWKKGHARNDAVLVMRKEGLAYWKKISGYHRRSLAETAMYRFKQLLAGKVSLRNYNGQVGEVMAYVSAINKLNTLGLPVRKPRV